MEGHFPVCTGRLQSYPTSIPEPFWTGEVWAYPASEPQMSPNPNSLSLPAAWRQCFDLMFTLQKLCTLGNRLFNQIVLDLIFTWVELKKQAFLPGWLEVSRQPLWIKSSLRSLSVVTKNKISRLFWCLRVEAFLMFNSTFYKPFLNMYLYKDTWIGSGGCFHF